MFESIIEGRAAVQPGLAPVHPPPGHGPSLPMLEPAIRPPPPPFPVNAFARLRSRDDCASVRSFHQRSGGRGGRRPDKGFLKSLASFPCFALSSSDAQSVSRFSVLDLLFAGLWSPVAFAL